MIAENLPTPPFCCLVYSCCLVCHARVYRILVDRIRSGLAATPKSSQRINQLLSDCLSLPNHERPFHIEASTLSSFKSFWFSCIYKPKRFFSKCLEKPCILLPALLSLCPCSRKNFILVNSEKNQSNI